MSQDSLQHSRLPDLPDIWHETLGWQPDAGHLLEFQSLYDRIVDANTQFNLTRIVEAEEFWEKHLWDSLRGVSCVLRGEVFPEGDAEKYRAIDIGTGAGFPGFPLAIARPDIEVMLLDSTRKKVNFLQQLAEELGMENIKTMTARAEEVGRQSCDRESYDLALARAVGPASVCLEYALPLLKIGGMAILYRGHWTEEETEKLSTTAAQLGGVISTVEAFTTPLTRGVRNCLYLSKIKPTPAQFPRAVGLPKQKPL
ncbi:MAG: 16S rRNA (guanine(527)-N(7))-methyltransferase RsmG [Cyanobacteria bacterium J007]|jgi:16S rRNA (guanine527-N7)-methyltransferase|nr:MAG: 16S rRNA (guanine(527)-N(7))-methyltransferase RsmG [Cyanobacteria bacterium J007]